MITPANRPDITDPSSFAEPIRILTPATGEPSTRPIEEAVPSAEELASGDFDDDELRPLPSSGPPESLPAIERSPKINWWRATLALAFAGLAYIMFADDFRFPWTPYLIVNEAAPRPMDQPVPLGVSVDSKNVLNFLEISGLPKGTSLSAGHALGEDGWSLYATDIKGAVIQPPPHFIGVMQLTVSLLVGSAINATESRPLRFEWVAEEAPATKLPVETLPAAQVETLPAAPVETPPAAQVETPPTAKAPEETPPAVKVQAEAPPAARAHDAPPSAAKAAAPTIHKTSPEETGALLKRGNALLASGDLAAARLVLQRAAEAGDASAAFALAGTYNPIALGELQVHGLAPDLGLARHWYERARDLGAPDAARELQILANRQN